MATKNRQRGFFAALGRLIRGIFLSLITLIGLVSAAWLGVRVFHWFNTGMTTTAGINESIWVNLGGITQAVQIRGQDNSNPVVIFLHGGPGMPVSILSYAFQPPLEDAYTFIQWDQRGSGRTYYAHPGAGLSQLTPEQLLLDLDDLVEYTRNRFGQDKVILLAHSWGTVLGSQYALQHPEKVRAYVAVGQVVDMTQMPDAEQIRAKAMAAGASLDVTALNAAEDRFQAALAAGTVDGNSYQAIDDLRIKYLACAGQISPEKLAYLGITSPTLNLSDARWYVQANDFNVHSALQEPLIKYLYLGYKAAEAGTTYKVPVHFISGACDWTTPTALVEDYEAGISAPEKSLTVIPNTGHNPFLDNPAAFAQAFRAALKTP